MIEEHETESNEDEEERPAFCPYTRESLLQAEARIAEEEAKRNERKKKREEGEVSRGAFLSPPLSPSLCRLTPRPTRRKGPARALPSSRARGAPPGRGWQP